LKGLKIRDDDGMLLPIKKEFP